MSVVYNENDEYAAQWLRNLIAAGHIAPGDVDTRSIVDIGDDDYRSYTQVHLFAGIGGWSLAARLAGWPDDRRLWTGSCPCQPFSGAGKRKGTADARHLWPEMRRLVSACRPPVVAGEQVVSKDGRTWLAGVRTDLEDMAYAVWAADTCAAGVGSPHIRQRLYWLADADGGLARHGGLQPGRQHGQQQEDDCDTQGLGIASRKSVCRGGQPWEPSTTIRCEDGERRIGPRPLAVAHGVPSRMGRLRAYGNAIVPQVAAEVLRAYLDGE